MKHAAVEKRWLGDYKTPPLEVRATGDGGSKEIAGHAAVFGRNSQNLGGFVEQVAPGAFAKTIAEADVRGLINHDANILLGRNVANTLALEEDQVGLGYEIDPPDTSAARDWLVLMERGDITQSSFSFRAIDVEWGLTSDDFPLRILRQVQLYDVSPVTFPAYLDTDAGVRSQAAFADLAERRSVKLEEVLELAAHNELRDLILDQAKPEDEKNDNESRGDEPDDEPTQTVTRLSIARRRLELSARRWAS